jgi:8-oxo-dGTP diphosphatase
LKKKGRQKIMQRFNCVIVIHPDKDRLLFCLRASDPYEGLYNFVGGKIEPGEDSLCAAYRELFEETGIARNDIDLVRFMDYAWHLQDMRMEVFAGTLKRTVPLKEEKHALCWLGGGEDFFDQKRFAGEGNIGHMVEILRISRLFSPDGNGV